MRGAEFESLASTVDTFTTHESELLSEIDSEMIQMDHERAAFVCANPSEFVG